MPQASNTAQMKMLEEQNFTCFCSGKPQDNMSPYLRGGCAEEVALHVFRGNDTIHQGKESRGTPDDCPLHRMLFFAHEGRKIECPTPLALTLTANQSVHYSYIFSLLTLALYASYSC